MTWWSAPVHRGIAAGLCAAMLMIALLGALRLTIGTSWVPELLGDRLVPFLPVAPFQWVIGIVGYNVAKLTGIVSGVMELLLVGAGLGVMRARWAARSGATVRLVASTVGVFVALVIVFWPNLDTSYRGLPAADARAANLFAHGVAFALFAFTLEALLRVRPVDRASTSGDDRSRRALLLGTAAIGVAAVGGVLARLIAISTLWYDGLQYRGAGVQPITPNDQFYVITKNVTDPVVDVAAWRLRIEGAVQHPTTFTLDDLRALRHSREEMTLMCVSNPVGGGLMSNAVWDGVPVARVIELAAPRPDVVTAIFRAADAYSDTLAFPVAMDEHTMLAFAMNGEDLPYRHGYPARLIVPGLFGEKSVKWLTRIELVDHPAKGFYESQGWGPDFVVPTHSRFDVPETGAKVPVGAATTLRGVAFAGTRGIGSVEISADGGRTWDVARIDYRGSSMTWALWSHAWSPAAAGEHELVVRATDDAGRPQVATDRHIVPQGSTGLHRVRIVAG